LGGEIVVPRPWASASLTGPRQKRVTPQPFAEKSVTPPTLCQMCSEPDPPLPPPPVSTYGHVVYLQMIAKHITTFRKRIGSYIIASTKVNPSWMDNRTRKIIARIIQNSIRVAFFTLEKEKIFLDL
jgi:hypothetical protein